LADRGARGAARLAGGWLFGEEVPVSNPDLGLVANANANANAPARPAPGPRGWPLLGDPAALRGTRNLLAYFEAYWRRYGDVFRVNVMGTSTLVVAHPEALQHVLSTHRQNYVKGKSYDGVRRVLGDGLLTLEGDAWRERRKLAQPAFHRRSLEKLTEYMTASGARYFDDLAARAGGAALEIDANREMVTLTLEVVVSALFGQSLEQTDVPYEALSDALVLISRNSNGVVLPAWVPTPNNLRMNRTLAELNRIVFRIIDRARRRRSDDGSLLSMLLAARDEHGNPLSDQAIRDDVLTLFIAGHETTALTLTWLFALLDQAPHVLARMQAEVRDVLGGRDPGFHDVAKLPYLRQVVDETLRLRSPAGFVARNALADDEIRGYPVRAGELVLLFLWGAHRHAEFWTDPEHFDPDRFAPGQDAGRDPWSYVPFSRGPRVCIGNTFSLTETVVLLAQLLNRFELEVRSCAGVRPIAVATVRPSEPVRVVVRAKPPR
jgi:cytochrome P450